jgi:excisionase family DNA binding protein
MTIKDAAVRLGKAELTVRRMVKAGKLPARADKARN